MKMLKYILIMLFAAVLSGCGSSKYHSDYYLFVGSYTKKPGQGIYVYKFNANDGSLSYVSKATGVENPSYVAVSPDQKYVYAVSELDKKGSINAFSFSKKTGKLTFLNKQSSKGGPAYIGIDHTGKYLFTANYGAGSFSEFAINEDGTLNPSMLTVQHHGSSVNKKRQSSPHVHSTQLTPDNKFLLVNDLGTDYVFQYAFNASTGHINKQPVYQYKVQAGAGPRHFAFSPDGKYAYLVTEMGGTVTAFRYNGKKLQRIQTVSAVPKDYKGFYTGSEVHVSPDGKFLYVSMREDLNQMVTFHINKESGKLKYVGRISTQGDQPRNFMIDPTGKYILVSNLKSNSIVEFKRNSTAGKLKPTDVKVDVHQPVCLQMIPAE
jgi:6-phosphogluconolactonase